LRAACTPSNAAKVRELRSRATRGEDVLDSGNASAQAKLEHYRAGLEMLEQITAEHPLVRQLRFELEILENRFSPDAGERRRPARLRPRSRRRDGQTKSSRRGRGV
jgi:hypothetical protein